MTRTARAPAVAGAFYPADPGRLAALVDGLLAGAEPPSLEALPSAIVVPHAGYAYSGAVAATAYAALGGAGSPRRVVVAGPAHFVPLEGMAVPRVDAWATPLGALPIDAELRRDAVAAGAAIDDLPHVPEHALEVQLPFLQRLIGPESTILPVAVGVAAATVVADVFARLLRAADRLVISTDLSHFLTEDEARRRDRRTADAIVARDPGSLGVADACGIFALRGLVELARREGLPITLLDLRTSADAGGDARRVVGYGAFAVG